MSYSVYFNGANIYLPGAYSKSSVRLTGGFPLAPGGIVGIVGEADAGMPGVADDIRENYFGPDEFASVVEKYKSGPIVDAFKILISPSNDSRVVNGAQKIYIYKTNISTKASGTLPTTYGAVSSESYGFDENTISFLTEASQAEVAPIFGFNFLTDETVNSKLAARITGKAKDMMDIVAPLISDDFVTQFNGDIVDIAATGGTDRLIVTAGMIAVETLAISFAANANGDVRMGVATVTCANGTLDVVPSVGDTLYVCAASILSGAGNENVGAYLILSATSTVITAIKLSDPTQAGLDVVAAPVAAAIDLEAHAPIVLTYDGTTNAGVGACIEAFDNTGTLNIGDQLYGGSDRGLLTNTQVVDGSKVSLTKVLTTTAIIAIDSAYAALARVGDNLWIRNDSVLAGAANVNVGGYVITAVSANSISVEKYTDSTLASVVATDIIAVNDVIAFAGFLSHSSYPLLSFSSAESKITIGLDRQSDSVSEDSDALGGNIVMKIGYDGTDATCTINSVNLVTAITGGSGAALTLKLSDYNTVQALVDYIDAQTGYSAAVGSNIYASLAPGTVLDQVAAVDVCEEHAGSMPGRIKKDSYEIQDFFDNSDLTSIVRTVFAGLPSTMTDAIFLTGGAKGGTTAASASTGVDELQKVRINSLVPLFSRDAVDDIVDEITEPSSTYQIAAINAAVKTHCLLMSNTKKRSERNCYISLKDNFTDSKTEANNIASFRGSLAIQDVKVLTVDGELEWKQPWALAALSAGMAAGAPNGEAITHKYINVSGIRHQDFDPDTEYDDALQNGILFAQQPSDGGFRMVLGNTTYGADASFVYNFISVRDCADTSAFELRRQLESIFVGVNSVVADAESVKSAATSILRSFLGQKLIKADSSNGGKGYKNLIIRIEGPVVRLSVAITPSQANTFILIDLVLEDIRESA